MFMQWTDGGNIMDHLRTRGEIKEGQTNLWSHQVVSAIKYLHSKDLARCNLRCDDLLICKENLKITGLDKIQTCTGDQKILIKHSKKMYKFYLSPEINNRVGNLLTIFQVEKCKANKKKTEFIVFSKSRAMQRKLIDNPPSINDQMLEWKESVKYLGVTIQQSIRRANKAISTLYFIFRKNCATSIEAKLTIYKAYIRPIITYAGTLLTNRAKTHVKKLQVFQNKCLFFSTRKFFQFSLA